MKLITCDGCGKKCKESEGQDINNDGFYCFECKADPTTLIDRELDRREEEMMRGSI